MVRDLLNQVRKPIHRFPGIDELLEPPGGVLSPVRQCLDRDKECPGDCPSGESVAGGVDQDLEPLPGLESGSFPGREPQEPGSEDLVFTAQLFHLLMEEVNIGGQRPPSGRSCAPEVVGLAHPAGNEEQGLDHPL